MDSTLYCYAAKVVRVIDVDTLQLAVDMGLRLTVEYQFRLLNVTMPVLRPRKGKFDGRKWYETEEQKKQIIEAAKKARAFVIESVLSRDVTVKTEKAESFNSYLVEVWYVADGNEISLNQDLLDRGHAEPYKRS